MACRLGVFRAWSAYTRAMFWLIAIASTTAWADEKADAPARAAIAARLDSLASLRVEYGTEEQATPPAPPAARGGPPAPPPNAAGARLRGPRLGVQRSTGKFSFLKGMSRFETRPSQESIDADIADRTIPVLGIIQT